MKKATLYEKINRKNLIGDDLRGRNESFKTHEKDILTKVIFFMMEGDDFDRKGRFE